MFRQISSLQNEKKNTNYASDKGLICKYVKNKSNAYLENNSIKNGVEE